MDATATTAVSVSHLPACPSWCSGGHAGTEYGETVHQRTFGATAVLDSETPLRVSAVTFDELLPDGSVRRTTPGISINDGPTGYELTLEQAAEIHWRSARRCGCCRTAQLRSPHRRSRPPASQLSDDFAYICRKIEEHTAASILPPLFLLPFGDKIASSSRCAGERPLQRLLAEIRQQSNRTRLFRQCGTITAPP